MKPGAAYYAGGVRVLVDGIPIRMSRKPSARDLADLRKWERVKAMPFGCSREDREQQAKQRAKEANDAIAIYAEMLEISVAKAKARIAAQRQHLMANPLVDLSLEYDL